MTVFRLFGLILGIMAAADRGMVSGEGLIQANERNRFVFDFDSIVNSSVYVSSKGSTMVKFALDFAIRSQWNSIAFFFSNSSEFYKISSPFIFKYFNAESKFVAIYSTSSPLFPRSLLHNRHRLGIVYFCDVPDEDFLNKASDLNLFDLYRSWLIIRPERGNDTKLEEIVKGLNLDLNTNLVLAKMERRTPMTAATTTTTVREPVPTIQTEIIFGYRKREVEDQGSRWKRDLTGDPNFVIQLLQVYKASKTENETLTINLGYWDVPNGLFKTKKTVDTEHRWDLGGYKISVGVKNSSQEVQIGRPAQDQFYQESEIDEEFKFVELLDCLMFGINASFELVQFRKLGWRTEEGGWTQLLGAVVDGTVEFALETLNVNDDKNQDLSFTYAILITMNNIYFRRPKSGGLRDIFLAPFSPRLLMSVLTTSILLAIAMISITIVNSRMIESKTASSSFHILSRGRAERSVVVTSKEKRRWEVSEAALWSISVLCMQGSQWSPNSLSGSLLLINSLLFALIIYNSFAAFITSVLSVKDVQIKDLKDLAESDFAFGYTIDTSDETFLRTVNNTLLKQLYYKGLQQNDGVRESIPGMHRTAKGRYAFFVDARTGRRALRTIVAHRTRCELQELYLPFTKNYASIPMTKKTSLKKILNLKIIRLLETGILQRFQKLILPSMPRCVEKTTFNSARFADVYSAFFVLVVGWFTSLIIFFVELVWRKRKKMRVRSHLFENSKGNDGYFWLN